MLICVVGLTVNQVLLDVAFQVVFEVTSIVAVLFASSKMDAVLDEIIRIGNPAACVTVIVFDITPVTAIVIVAIRSEVDGFGVVLKVSEPFPITGVFGFTVSHDASELAVHVPVVVTLIGVEVVAILDTDKVVSETEIVGVTAS